MYILASVLKELPVISLQTGEAVATVTEPVFDPGDLSVVAVLCSAGRGSSSKVLMMRDVRQVATDCLIVDSDEELADSDDVVRLKSLLTSQLKPIGLPVVTDLGRKLGSVEDYTINLETARLQKLYIRQSIIRSWLGSSLIIDRTQIIDVNQQHIVVRDASVKAPVIAGEPVPETQA
jgi:sporulation protein YlmC with PRC-barrel domain